MTNKETPKARNLKPRLAKPDHPIYSAGFVVGGKRLFGSTQTTERGSHSGSKQPPSTSVLNRSTDTMTGKKTQKAKPLKIRSAPADHPIYRLGFVIGGIGRNRLPEVTPPKAKDKDK